MYSERDIQKFLAKLNITAAVDIKEVKRVWLKYCLLNHPDKLGYESVDFHQMTQLYRENFQDMTNAKW